MREKPLILVVDDEKDLREIMALKLGASGFEAIVAADAKEAVAAAKQSHPDLVLMDIHMPGETGTDAALAIKQDPETKDTRVAFLSSMKDPWPRVQANRDSLTKEMGAEEYIDKSEDLDNIVARVREILAK